MPLTPKNLRSPWLILSTFLLLGFFFYTVNQSPDFSLFAPDCPNYYHKMVLKPTSIKAQIIAIKGNSTDRHNPVTLELANNTDTLNIPWNIAWASSDSALELIDAGDSLFKSLGSLDILIVKPNKEWKLYKFTCL